MNTWVVICKCTYIPHFVIHLKSHFYGSHICSKLKIHTTRKASHTKQWSLSYGVILWVQYLDDIAHRWSLCNTLSRVLMVLLDDSHNVCSTFFIQGTPKMLQIYPWRCLSQGTLNNCTCFLIDAVIMQTVMIGIFKGNDTQIIGLHWKPYLTHPFFFRDGGSW